MDISRRDALTLLGAVALGPLASAPAVAAPGQLYPIHAPVPVPRLSLTTFVARATGGYMAAGSESDGLKIARYTAASEPESPLQTLAFPGTTANGCRLAVLSSGDAILAFKGALASTPGNFGVFVMPLNDAGAATGPAIRISLPSGEIIYKLAACRLAGGSVLVAWQDGNPRSARANVRWRIVGAGGTPETAVKTITRVSGFDGHWLLAVAALPGGEAFIGYMRDVSATGPGPALLQKIDASGAAAGAPIKLGATTNVIDLASTPEGVAALWHVRAVDEDHDAELCLRKVSADGTLGRVKSTSAGFYSVEYNGFFDYGLKLTRAADGRFVALVSGWDIPPPGARAVSDNYVKAFVFNESLGYNSQLTVAFVRDKHDAYLVGDAMALPLLNNGSLVACYWSGHPTARRNMQRMRLV